MLFRKILILPMALTFAAFVAGQARVAEDNSLPKQLSEDEVQSIIKHNNPKSHVEAALKVSDKRLAQAINETKASRFKNAIEEVDVYASIIIYADGYARQLPPNKIKDRNNCLKRLEQAIFKQSRNLEFISREIPFSFREPVEDKILEVRKIRAQAIDDLLGGGKPINSSNRK